MSTKLSRSAAVKLERKLRNEWGHGRASRALTSILLLLGNNILPCFNSMSSERNVMGVRRQEGIIARTDSTLARLQSKQRVKKETARRIDDFDDSIECQSASQS